MWRWGTEFGPDVDYFPICLNVPSLTEAGDVIPALEQIAGLHPTKVIRDYARKLADSIDGVVNAPVGGSADPGVADYRQWVEQASGLIDALHDPGHRLAR